MLPILEEVLTGLLKAPPYHLALEGILLVLVVWLLLRKSYNPKERVHLTEKEKEELIAEWEPEPLVPPTDPNHPALKTRIVEGKIGKHIKVNGHECLNFGTHNYLGLNGTKEVENAAVSCLERYGVGSCGPRGFYGTSDVHLEFEERLANFLGVQESVLYSYGFATIASAIPAYAKKGDVIFVDDAVHFAIQKGLDASRSKIKFFRHNDMDHLQQILEEHAAEERKNPKRAAVVRKFIVVEGIYYNRGDICPLPKIVELRKKYKLRLFVDESVSVGTVGSTGKGVFEHFGISINEADFVSGSLEYAFASIGGFVAGTSFVVDHQRLSGLGYCFSASLPPLLAAAAIAVIDRLESEAGKNDLAHLRRVCRRAHELLLSNLNQLELYEGSFPESPVKHLKLRGPFSQSTREQDHAVLTQIVAKAEEKGVAVVVSAYLEKQEKFPPPENITFTLNARLEESEVEHGISVLQEACDEVFDNLVEPEENQVSEESDEEDSLNHNSASSPLNRLNSPINSKITRNS